MPWWVGSVVTDIKNKKLQSDFTCQASQIQNINLAPQYIQIYVLRSNNCFLFQLVFLQDFREHLQPTSAIPFVQGFNSSVFFTPRMLVFKEQCRHHHWEEVYPNVIPMASHMPMVANWIGNWCLSWRSIKPYGYNWQSGTSWCSSNFFFLSGKHVCSL